MWCIYIAPFPYECSKALYNDQFTASGPKVYIHVSAGTHLTDRGRIESCVNFSKKGGHPNIQPRQAGNRTGHLRIGRQRSLPLAKYTSTLSLQL